MPPHWVKIIYSSMDSDSDEEIFFGPVSAREEKISSKLKHRTTEVFTPGVPLFRRRSSRPSLASLEEDEKVFDNDSTTSLVVHGNSTCNTVSSDIGDQVPLSERAAENISSQSSDLNEYTDESSLSATDSLQGDHKPLFVLPSRLSVKVANEGCETEVEITQYSSNNVSQEMSSAAAVEASCESGDSALHSGSYLRSSEEESFAKNDEALDTTEEEIPEHDIAEQEVITKLETDHAEDSIKPSAPMVENEVVEVICREEEKIDDSDDVNEAHVTVGHQISATSDGEKHIIEDEFPDEKHMEEIKTPMESDEHVETKDFHEELASEMIEKTDEVAEICESHEDSDCGEKVADAESMQHSEALSEDESKLSVKETPSYEEGERDINKSDLSNILSHSRRFLSQLDGNDSDSSVSNVRRPRESYYSSLEVINVNEPLLYSSFITEENIGLSSELEQENLASEKITPQLLKELKPISPCKMYSSSTCETLSVGSDSVFGSVERNTVFVSDIHENRITSDMYNEILEDDDAVFNDDDCGGGQKSKVGSIDDSPDVKHVSPVTPPPKGFVLKTNTNLNEIFTVTPPPNTIPTLRKVISHSEETGSPIAVSYLSYSSQNLGDSGADSYGSANRAMILSKSDDYEAASSTSQPSQSSAECEEQSQSTHSNTETQIYQSPMSQYRSGWTTYHTAKEGLDSSRDDSSDEEQSPEHKFNDTIEEMEMMLKYGLNYGENADTKESLPSPAVEENKGKNFDVTPTIEDNEQSDSIVSPRKSSVASTVSNFKPNMDSTHSSTLREDMSKYRSPIHSPEIFEVNAGFSPTIISHKKQKEAPPKPPRNLNSQHTNSLQSHVERHSKLQSNRSPISKLTTTNRPKLSPLSLTPKVFKPSTPRNVVTRHTISRVKNDAPLVRSNSLTNIYRTPKSGQSNANTPVRSTTGSRSQQNTPVSRTALPIKKNSPNVLPKISTGRPGLPPRAPIGKTSQKPNVSSIPNKFSTPQGQSTRTRMQVSSVNKILSPSVKAANNLKFQQGLSIVSPVAKYLKENPPPPLVVNVKPKHKISPVKIQKENVVNQNSPQGATLSKIQGDLEKLTSKMKTAQIDCDKNNIEDPLLSKRRVLPKATYMSAPAVVDSVENKENERIRKRREIPTDKHPVLVMKHKGRMKLPKVTFKEGLIDSSPKGQKSPSFQSPTVSSLKNRASLRNSLMEVSIYESHETKYTSTLQK